MNALSAMMLKHYNPFTEEYGIQVLQKMCDSTYELIIVSKIVTTQVGFSVLKTRSRQVDQSLVSNGDGVAIQRHLAGSASITCAGWMGSFSWSKKTPALSFRLHFDLIAFFTCVNSDVSKCSLTFTIPNSLSYLRFQDKKKPGKTDAITLPKTQLLEWGFLRKKSWVFPLFALNLWFRLEVVNWFHHESLIWGRNSHSFYLEASQLCPGNINSFESVLWHQYSWEPSCTQLTHHQNFR